MKLHHIFSCCRSTAAEPVDIDVEPRSHIVRSPRFSPRQPIQIHPTVQNQALTTGLTIVNDIVVSGIVKNGVSCIRKGHLPIGAQPSVSTTEPVASTEKLQSDEGAVRAKTVDKSVQTEAVAFETVPSRDPLWPPPPAPCSKCNIDHGSCYCMPSKRFSWQELKDLTSDFSVDRRFGFRDDDNLYTGRLDGRLMFVARRDTASDFSIEVNILKSLRHPNIVFLIGYCDEVTGDINSRALVFNFVCNRTLFFHLTFGTLKPMRWPDRANLAVKLGECLLYLHSTHIIHGNINSMNVFVTHDFVPVQEQLIAGKNDPHGKVYPGSPSSRTGGLWYFPANVDTVRLDSKLAVILESLVWFPQIFNLHMQLGEFSLSRNIDALGSILLPNRKEDKRARGYLPPEYEAEYEAGKKLSEKQDIYAFGVILFELVSGRPAFDRTNKTNMLLGEWGRNTVKESDPTQPCKLLAKLQDPRLMGAIFNKCDMLRMVKVAEICTSENPNERPYMPVVLAMLTGNIDFERRQAPADPEQPPADPEQPPADPEQAPADPEPANQETGADQDTLRTQSGSALSSSKDQTLRDLFQGLKTTCEDNDYLKRAAPVASTSGQGSRRPRRRLRHIAGGHTYYQRSRSIGLTGGPSTPFPSPRPAGSSIAGFSMSPFKGVVFEVPFNRTSGGSNCEIGLRYRVRFSNLKEKPSSGLKWRDRK